MKNMIKWLMIGIITALPLISFATVKPLTDCSVLAMPKTVLLVHSSTCYHCKVFMSTYKQVSDQEEYKDWTFYEREIDDSPAACGVRIRAVPIVFKNNMTAYLKGNKSQYLLEEFLKAV